jgi:YHS domain-containing protein
MKITKVTLFILCLFFVSTFIAQTTEPNETLRKKQFNLEKSGYALMGYDPLSYFTGKPKNGSAQFTYKYHGVSYKFSSDKNRQLFMSAPEKFEPAYGGWCAYAMGTSGEKVEVDPETYKIIDGKLYLFYNAYFNNTLPKWNAKEKHLLKQAESYWQNIYK